eukprot:TRINITY_DN15756_c0_g1_i16.p3 TRINITY_DN15756_c0_g1~~TRINITY_DN15756_c0_g1_i16.p3  ORF type:complete len:119 (+),score=31.20 TRINITY_DN15756_c0_g1_i16:520-876(+)
MIAAAQQQAMKRSDKVLHQSAEERAQLSHRLELSAQWLQQLPDAVSSVGAVGGLAAHRLQPAARPEERRRRDREPAQRLPREREGHTTTSACSSTSEPSSGTGSSGQSSWHPRAVSEQ